MAGEWKGIRDRTMMSMWSQSAPRRSMRSASEARLAKSDESIDGAIFAAAMTDRFPPGCFLLRLVGGARW